MYRHYAIKFGMFTNNTLGRRWRFERFNPPTNYPWENVEDRAVYRLTTPSPWGFYIEVTREVESLEESLEVVA